MIKIQKACNVNLFNINMTLSLRNVYKVDMHCGLNMSFIIIIFFILSW